MSGGEWIFVAFYAGFAIGCWVNRKPPIIKDAKINANLVIDQNVLEQIGTAQVMTWLEQRGLVWQPKGAVFDPGRDVKK